MGREVTVTGAALTGAETGVATGRVTGFPARRGSMEDAQVRAVTGIGFSQDPAGNPLEFFYAPMVTNKFKSPHDMKFLTGDMGLGHINLFVRNFDECARFYKSVLGFKLTDALDVDRAPGGRRLPRGEADCVARLVDAGAPPVDPPVAERLVDRLRPGDGRPAGRNLVEADEHLCFGRVMAVKPIAPFLWGAEVEGGTLHEKTRRREDE